MEFLNFRMPGRYHSPGLAFGPDASQILTVDRIYAVPFYCAGAHTFDRIAYHVSTAVAGGLTRLAVYLDNDSIYPGSRVLASDELTGASTGLKETIVDWTSVANKLYWLAMITNRAIYVRSLEDIYSFGCVFGYGAAMPTDQDNHYYKAQAYGALPETFPGGATISYIANVPTVFLRQT